MPIKKDSKGLTIKQKKFVKAYVENDGNGTKAALETYDTNDYFTANQISVDNLQKPTIRQAIDNAFIKYEIGIDDAIEPISKAMKATVKVRVDGEIIDTGEADLDMQLKGSDRYLKLIGADKGEAITPAAVHFHQHIEEKKSGYSF